MFDKKKIFLFGVFFFLTLALVTLHHPLFCLGIKSYLSTKLPKGGKLTFEYQAACIEGGQIVLHGVTIERAKKEGCPNFYVQVDDLKIDFDFQLFPFYFKPRVVFDHPQVALIAGDLSAAPKKKSLYQTLDKHLFRTPITIHQGELRFKNQVAFISFENPEEGKAGRLRLYKGEGEMPAFSATFSKENQELQFEMIFENLDVAWVFEIGRYVFPMLTPELRVQEGSISGELAFGLSSLHHIDYVKYSLDLNDFLLTHEKYGLHFGVQYLGWKEHFTSNLEGKEMGSHVFLEKVWPCFVGNGELKGMKITIEDPIEKNSWTATDVRGNLHFSRQSKPHVLLHGTFNRGKKEYPFQLIGEGLIESDTLWKVAVDVNLLNEVKTQTYFSLTSKEDHQYLIQTEFSHVNTDLLSLFHHLIAVHFPKAQKLKIDDGMFKGKMQGWVEEKELKRCEVIDFLSENVKATLPCEKITWNAQEMKGKGEFDFSTPDFFDGTFWELDVVEGRIGFDEEEQVKRVDFHIAMHDQYIKPSKLSCYLNGIEGQVSFEGLYTHLNLNVALDLSSEELSYFLGLKKSKELKEKIALDLDVHLKTMQEKMAVEGALGFLHGEKQKDSIQFGWSWDLNKLALGNIKEALDLGFFKAEDLSDQTLNLALIFWEKNWRALGKVDIEGTFNSHAVEFSLDPTHLIYKSSAIDIEPNKREGEKVPSCTFNFDFKEKNWRGKIPLKKVRLKEHFFGIEFDSFTSEVDLEQTKFLFQTVDAIANDVHFQAEMALDYHLEDRNKLTINTYRIDGKTEDILSFLHHFKSFAALDFPLEGVIMSGPGEMHLCAYIGNVEELLEWKIALHFQKGRFPFSKTLAFENLAGDLYYSAEDQLFKIKKTEGLLLLSAGEQLKSYELNIPLLELDAVHGIWNYDLRLEAPTHDICRIAGTALKKEKELFFLLDQDQTHLFGTKINVSKLSFSEEGFLSQVCAKATFSALDLFHHVDFLSSAGLMPLKPIIVNEMRTPKFEGEVSMAFTFDRKKEFIDFEAKSERLLCGPMNLDHLAIHVDRQGDHVTLDQFEAGSFAMKASIDKHHDDWSMPQFEIAWKSCCLNGGEGRYNKASKKLKLPLENLKVEVQELSNLFPLSEVDWSYLTGTFFLSGVLFFDFSEGLKTPSFNSEIKLIGQDFGKGKLRLESSDTLYLSFDTKKGFQIKEANFNFLHPKSNELWAKCHFDTFSYNNREWKGENFILLVPPEMMHFLGQTHSFPHLSYEEERLILFEYPLRWDNQIEATMNFTLGKKSNAEGRLKEGYYWIGDKAWYLNDFAFTYENAAFDLNLNTLFDEMPFDLKMHLSFLPHFTSKIFIQETFREEQGSDDPLVIQTTWNEQEGYFVRSIGGQVCGLDFDFHHNPKESFLDRSVLTGQLKVNVPALSKFLPENFQKSIKDFEIGKGYELSGDLILSKLKLEDSYFMGYLKGKNFQLMGSSMETLMSEITIHPNQIELSNFNISDASGIFKMERVHIHQEQDQRWNLVIPELAIQDFRPSLLKKIGKYPGRIKPLTIRELYFHNIRGYLSDAKSFTGKGHLNFINTFKRDYNLLDIPFEILGRLGLDMGLLVPVRGDLNFIMVDGRIYFTELKKSYSEGKRSQFFLSGAHPSYIDFDGNLNINIKMKQYVLLKLTEPFTLSIAGTFENPKYGLK